MQHKNQNRLSLFAVCRDYLDREPLWDSGNRLIVAVSGGVDSVALADIIMDLKVDFAIAHCNFGLRGDESDRDEHFSASIASSYGVPFFKKRFKTFEYAYSKGISVEMAARELRYEWFNDLLDKNGFHFVATGHHADDQIETLFLNLSRGTGISGLRGMLPKTGRVVRPLLPFFRADIESYAREKGLSWIEDSTNSSTEIKRNRIRHEIVPMFESLNPNFRETLTRTMRNIRDAEIIYMEALETVLKTITKEEPGVVRVSVEGLKKLHPREAYLYELLSAYGFNSATTERINSSLDGLPGKQFLSATHRVVKDRGELLITKLSQNPDDKDDWQYLINEDDRMIDEPLQITVMRQGVNEFVLQDNPAVAALDFHKLSFPLTLRRWNHGDLFYPLGMRNRKKLSDLFSDLKLSIVEKEQVWVLLSGDQIVWVAGRRIDNRFRVTSKTKEVYVLKLHC